MSFILSVVIYLSSCLRVDDSEHFNGEVFIVDDNVETVDLPSERIELTGVFDGEFAVYDGLAFFGVLNIKTLGMVCLI